MPVTVSSEPLNKSHTTKALEIQRFFFVQNMKNPLLLQGIFGFLETIFVFRLR